MYDLKRSLKCLCIGTAFKALVLNICMALKKPLKYNGCLQEESQLSSSSGCRTLGRGAQGYDVTTTCFQLSYTINTPVHSILSGPLDSPTRESMSISVVRCRFVRLTSEIIGCCWRINLQCLRSHPTTTPLHHPLQCKIFQQNDLSGWKDDGQVCARF